MNARATEVISVKGLSRSFGGLHAVSNVDLTLQEGARTALIGPNGAGKTSLVNLISGSLKAGRGEIIFNGRDVTNLSQAERVRQGMGRTFQINRLFKELTVLENISAAILQRRGRGMALWQSQAQSEEIAHEVHQVLSELKHASMMHRVVGEMALGEQRLVEIALALSLKPKLLLLDEPAAGVPQSESGVILDAVANLPANLTVLLIEHDMDLVFRFAKRIVVLATGSVLAEGTADEIAKDVRVKEVYFGRGGHH